MPRNIEIKASVSNVTALITTSASLADSAPTLIRQDDTFFACANGRLKLRAFPNGSGELIFYQRANQDGPKSSFYDITPTHDAASLRNTLSLAFGAVGRVIKNRTVYFIGRTRVHIDEVENLGNFMELEVVVEDGESEESGIQEAHALMTALGIHSSALIKGAYVDLLDTRCDQ